MGTLIGVWTLSSDMVDSASQWPDLTWLAVTRQHDLIPVAQLPALTQTGILLFRRTVSPCAGPCASHGPEPQRPNSSLPSTSLLLPAAHATESALTINSAATEKPEFCLDLFAGARHPVTAAVRSLGADCMPPVDIIFGLESGALGARGCSGGSVVLRTQHPEATPWRSQASTGSMGS